jgi:hypothetical protein
MQHVNLGIIGSGTVGGGVYQAIKRNGASSCSNSLPPALASARSRAMRAKRDRHYISGRPDTGEPVVGIEVAGQRADETEGASHFRAASGSLMRNIAPRPARFSAVSWPPWPRQWFAQWTSPYPSLLLGGKERIKNFFWPSSGFRPGVGTDTSEPVNACANNRER